MWDILFIKLSTQLRIKSILMKVKITDEMENDREEEIIIEKTSVKDILKRLDIDPFEAIVMKKGEIILESDIITNEDEIKIINVIHGG